MRNKSAPESFTYIPKFLVSDSSDHIKYNIDGRKHITKTSNPQNLSKVWQTQ